jgi:hypothetical protein
LAHGLFKVRLKQHIKSLFSPNTSYFVQTIRTRSQASRLRWN